MLLPACHQCYSNFSSVARVVGRGQFGVSYQRAVAAGKSHEGLYPATRGSWFHRSVFPLCHSSRLRLRLIAWQLGKLGSQLRSWEVEKKRVGKSGSE